MPKVPLYIVTGVSGSGKTFVAKELRRIMPDYVVFDYDTVFNVLRNSPEKVDKHQVQKIWLRVARDIAESGRKTIICGLIKPQDIEICKEIRYFSHIHYLILHCDDQTREMRLSARENMTNKKIQYIKKLAKWFVEIADKYKPPIPIIDTTKTEVSKVAEQIKEWIIENEQ